MGMVHQQLTQKLNIDQVQSSTKVRGKRAPGKTNKGWVEVNMGGPKAV